MQSFHESLTAWATLLGAIASLVGLIQSRTWLAGMGALCLLASMIAGVYARRESLLLKSASIEIDGKSIDSLNVANLRRRTNKSLVVQAAHHTAIVRGENLRMIWRYSGYCNAEEETAAEFSVDSDHQVPFSQLECFGFDLRADPDRQHVIHPLLIGADGLSKKVQLPFLVPLKRREPFDIMLTCNLPGCLPLGVEYVTSTFSFAQDILPAATVRLIFITDAPEWVRLYKCSFGTATLVKALRPVMQDSNRTEYVDTSHDVEAQSSWIYMFQRSVLSEAVIRPRQAVKRPSAHLRQAG